MATTDHYCPECGWSQVANRVRRECPRCGARVVLLHDERGDHGPFFLDDLYDCEDSAETDDE